MTFNGLVLCKYTCFAHLIYMENNEVSVSQYVVYQEKIVLFQPPKIFWFYRNWVSEKRDLWLYKEAW